MIQCYFNIIYIYAIIIFIIKYFALKNICFLYLYVILV